MMIISFFIDRLQYTTRFTLRNSFEVVLIHSSIIDYPEYTEALHKVLQRHWVYLCNMFIMTRSQFEAYAAWLFAILFQAEKMIVLTGDVYQDRVFGFLAERLFNVYVEKQKFKIIEVPAIFVDPAVHSDSTQRIGKRALLKDLFS